MAKRVIDLLLTGARQAVPVGGIFALGWPPTVAIAVYWLESALLVAIALDMCVRLRARTSEAAIVEARAAGDTAHADALQREAKRRAAAGVNPGDVLLFHGASIAFFGVFFGLILVMLTLNGRIEPFDWTELQYAAGGMAAVLVLGFAFDYLVMPDPPLDVVVARVNACLGRWALMWLLGFGGLSAMMLTGRPQVFFQMFAGLKTTWEVWGLLARTFGWTSPGARRAA